MSFSNSYAKENKYKDIMGKLESNNNYKAKNTLGYLGKYQMGKIALVDLGFINGDVWVGKKDIRSEKDFLNSPKIQEYAMDLYTSKNYRYLKNKGVLKFIGTNYKDIKVTLSGLLACAHLLGAGGTSKMFKTGKVGKDAYGTKGTKYLKLVQGLEVDYGY